MSEKNGNYYIQEYFVSWMRYCMWTHCSYSGRETNGHHDWVTVPQDDSKPILTRISKRCHSYTHNPTAAEPDLTRGWYSYCICAESPYFFSFPLWEFSSPTSDWICAPCNRSRRVITTGLPGKSESPYISIPTIFECKWLKLNSFQQSSFFGL